MPDKVAIVVKGYPRLSETFIAQEILGLQQRGLDFEIISLRHPTDKKVHALNQAITAPVSYLPEYLYQEPGRVLRGLAKAVRTAGFGAALKTWLKDLRRDRTANRVRRFGQACVLAAELGPEVGQLYAHFLHTPASVARYAAMMRGLPWSCSAHARDIYTSPDWELQEKLADVNWLVTCTKFNVDHLNGLAGRSDAAELLYHGLNFDRFPAPPETRPDRDGSSEENRVEIISVGRMVRKKGYDVLLKALAQLPNDLHWRFIHIGGGKLTNEMTALADELGLSDRIDWCGARDQVEVVAAYQSADMFALASRIDGDGDRDGLPNVLMEAQLQKLPVASTAISAIPEIIDEGENGLLAPSEDPAAMAASLERMIRDPALRHRMGNRGYEIVTTRFSFQGGVDRLAEKFGLDKV